MSLAHWLIVTSLRALTSMIARIDDHELKNVPDHGPLIIVSNHVNVLEIPIIYTHLQPRPATGFVDADRWKAGWSRWLLNTCHAIPLHRGQPDLSALRQGMELLRQGWILIIDPEGTRSGDGRLQEGHAGVVTLALHSGTPLMPVAFCGGEGYKDNLRRLRRTDFHIRVGRLFTVDPQGEKVTGLVRRQMIDEIMAQIAVLLPSAYQGVYASPEKASCKYLKFISYPELSS